MKFGSFVIPSRSYEKLRRFALKVEELGFDSIHTPDHLIGQQQKEDPWLEAITLMTALAVETSKIKLGFAVICNSFRNPAYLAKVISTIDHISNGRTLMWLGAGWNKAEYRQYGYPFPKAHVRVDQLEEALTIYKKMFTEDKFTFEGKFWTLKRTLNNPKPIQKPYPQIVIGTAGLRMTDIACREADGINIMPSFKATEIPERISLIKENLKKYNRDPSEFEISLLYPITLVKTQEELEKFSEGERTNTFTGYPEDIKERLTVLEDLGLNKMVVMRLSSPDFDHPLKVFSEKVM
jgi:alkanesulfonate monooxygenase SsuD/methylene tetrahydromethanopterin reductase-like flavin-dependent oxidoreductase (luciferase family)